MMNLIYTLVGYIYSTPFMILLFGTAIYFTVRMKFPQFRLLRDMFHLSFDSGDDKVGVSPFQSLMMTVGGRVGIGNIAGVVAAIACGGPGAVFWMWLLQFVGGPAFYIEAGLHNKPLALVSAFCVLFATTISAPGVQLNSICSSVSMLGIPTLVTGLVILLVLAIVIFGGIKRIAKVCGVLAPIMAIAYMAVAIIIAVFNITKNTGQERNVDLATTLLRMGFHSLLFSYRGCWGSEGRFSFGGCIEDTETVLDYILSDKTGMFDKENIFIFHEGIQNLPWNDAKSVQREISLKLKSY
ncbi:MAG: alanine:cation symporter family protein [Lachnospiraceae bacterium]|nr:alanine:cation symporter family protein [Lachnospiraceae bacterium]